VKTMARTGRRVGNLWVEDDGTVKSLARKCLEEQGPLPPDTPHNYGSKEFQKANEQYMRMLFGDGPVDYELERQGLKSLLAEDEATEV